MNKKPMKRLVILRMMKPLGTETLLMMAALDQDAPKKEILPTKDVLALDAQRNPPLQLPLAPTIPLEQEKRKQKKNSILQKPMSFHQSRMRLYKSRTRLYQSKT